MESRIQTLKIEIEKLQNSKVEDEVIPQTDTTTMQLYVYHGLGIELTEEDDCLKARIQSSSTNDIYTVKIDDKLSPHFVANHIWDLAQ
ncbi:hypothetical protein G9A89_005554 [Geosiphon pyriformis]|nr:hypothetical protein G9A89_005554 [Geosiphon pyriformis]